MGLLNKDFSSNWDSAPAYLFVDPVSRYKQAAREFVYGVGAIVFISCDLPGGLVLLNYI